MDHSDILIAIEELEKTLKCPACSCTLDSPIIVGACGDTICKKCLTGCQDNTCSVCKLPIDVADSFEDKQLHDLLPLVKRLKVLMRDELLLNKKSTDDIHNDAEVETVEETPFSASVRLSNSIIADSSRPNRTPKAAKCKLLNCGSQDDSDHLYKTILETPQNKVLKKRPLSSPAFKTPKRPLRHFTSSFSAQKKATSFFKSPSSVSPVNVEKKNNKGETLLHQATIRGDVAAVKDLLARNANPNVKDNAGWTPLHEACHHGFLDIVKLLVENGAYLEVHAQNGITPLHDAVMTSHLDIAKYLCLKGADIYAITYANNNALDLCGENETNKDMLLKGFELFSMLKPTLQETEVKEILPKKKQKLVLLPTSLSDKQKDVLQKCAEVLKADIVDDFCAEVTHVITSCDSNGQCIRTLKLLQGILTGKWIVNAQWSEICLEYQKHVEEEAFEIPGAKQMPDTFGPKQSRENAKKELPLLFHGLSFYLHGQFSSPLPAREDLYQLIQFGGGKLITREPKPDIVVLEEHIVSYHAKDGPFADISHVILYGDKPPRNVYVNSNHICTVNVRWIMDSICAFKLLNMNEYNKV